MAAPIGTMLSDVLDALPTLLWIVFLTAAGFVLRNPIKQQLLPRLSGVSAFGVDLSFVTGELEQAALKQSVELPSESGAKVLRRANQ